MNWITALGGTILLACLGGCATSPTQRPQEQPVVEEETTEFWLCEGEESDRIWDCKSSEETILPPDISKIAIPDAESERDQVDLSSFLRALEAANRAEDQVEGESEEEGTVSISKLRNPPYRSLAHFMEADQSILDLPGDFLAVELASSENQEEIDAFILGSDELVRELLQIIRVADAESTRFIVLLGIYRDKNRADVAALSYRNDFEGSTTAVHRLAKLQAGILAARSDRTD